MTAAPGQTKEWDELTYQAYARTFDDERHLNNLQSTMRSFASAWLLATFAAIGYVLLSKKDDIWICPPHLVLAILPVMGGAGISVLCVLDQIVYRRMLSGVILTGLQMEFYNPFLPPARATGMLMSKKARDLGHTQGFLWFYQIPLMFLVLIATGSSLLLLFELPSATHRLPLLIFSTVVGITTLIAPWVGSTYLLRKLGAYNANKNHDDILDKELRRILDQKDFRKIVNQYELAQRSATNAKGHPADPPIADASVD